jgi:hypothetical protein
MEAGSLKVKDDFIEVIFPLRFFVPLDPIVACYRLLIIRAWSANTGYYTDIFFESTISYATAHKIVIEISAITTAMPSEGILIILVF